jgi:hypothetical protein
MPSGPSPFYFILRRRSRSDRTGRNGLRALSVHRHGLPAGFAGIVGSMEKKLATVPRSPSCRTVPSSHVEATTRPLLGGLRWPSLGIGQAQRNHARRRPPPRNTSSAPKCLTAQPSRRSRIAASHAHEKDRATPFKKGCLRSCLSAVLQRLLASKSFRACPTHVAAQAPTYCASDWRSLSNTGRSRG